MARKTDNGLKDGKIHGIGRSPEWPRIQKEHIKMEPKCACCGKGKDQVSLQVHHKFPFHYCVLLGRPDLELDHRNLITLCETTKNKESDNHHLLIGHLDNFKSSNLHVDADCKEFFGFTQEQLKENDEWKCDESKRLKLLTDMTDQEKEDFKELMNKTYPIEKI